MKKLLSLLIVVCCLLSVISCGTSPASEQNEKPYKIDLSHIETSNDDNSMTFDKASGIVTVNRDYINQSCLGLWVDEDITNYNILRIKYKALGDYGFHINTEYENDPTSDWWGDNTYCPSYLTEMVIPIKTGVTKLKFITISSVSYIWTYKFRIDEITLEKVSNPQKTDVAVSNEPPLIDTASDGTFNDSISAWDFVNGLGAGFHYGAFHSVSAWQDFGLDSYSWSGDIKPKKEIIQTIKNKGFKTLRLQVASYCHLLDDDYTIDPRFMKTVKDVIDWAIEEDMYVILCGPLAEMFQDQKYLEKASESVHFAGFSVSENEKEESLKFLKAIWLQYAKIFNNSYDEHLIFETLNEPIDCFHEHAWRPRLDCSVCIKDFEILKEYNQLIVDTIRSTGGNNEKRFIMVEGLAAGNLNCISIANENSFSLPNDTAEDKLIPTFHYYPMEGGKPISKKVYSRSVKIATQEMFASFDSLYFSKHIPVYMSEGFHDRSIPIMERISCLKDFMAEAKKTGRSCNVTMINDADYLCQYNAFGILSYQDLKWYDSEYVNTLIYACDGKEYPLSEDFVKKNTLIIESIVGKNLLPEPVEKNGSDDATVIKTDLLVRSTPSEYKFEFQIETTDPDAVLQVSYNDSKLVWRELVQQENVTIQGGTLKDGWCIAISESGTVTLSIDEKLALDLECAEAIYINGCNIIIKSMKVVE